MFSYKEDCALSYKLDSCDQSTAHWLEKQEASVFHQLSFVFSLLRAGFFVSKRNARITLFTIAMEQLSVSEQFAMLIYVAQGKQIKDVDESICPMQEQNKAQIFERNIECDPQAYSELLWESARQVEMIAALFQEGIDIETKKEVIIQLERLYQKEIEILCAIKRLLENECPMEEVLEALVHVSDSDDKPDPQFFSKRDIELDSFEN